MFPTSTQCKYWMFSSEDELNKLRENANLKHIQTYGKHVAVSSVQIQKGAYSLFVLFIQGTNEI